MQVAIARRGDPRVADYTGLRDVAWRRHLEAEQGLFLAEGEKVIRRAAEAGYRPRSFLLAPRWLSGLEDILIRWPDVPVYVLSADLAEEITGFHVHRGALAAFHREQRYRESDLLGVHRLIVLEDLVDHTNVGAILRCAAGLGWDGALLAPRAADPLYRRSVKVSMGAVFSLPWARADDWVSTPDGLRAAGFVVVALTLTADAVPLPEFAARVKPQERLAVLLGTEGSGLSHQWTRRSDVAVRIPMHGGIDSLNVAAAAAIACYSLGRFAVTGQSSG